MSTTYRPEDLLVLPGQAEKTSSDLDIVFRTSRLDGKFSIMEGEVKPGELVSFHSHVNEDQHMFMIEGELHFEIGGKDGVRFTAGPGCHILKPRGSLHGFWNLGETTARYVETSTLDGFERFIDSRAGGVGAMMGNADDGLGIKFDLMRAMEVMREFDLTGLSGINAPAPHVLARDANFRHLIATDSEFREFALHLGGLKLKEIVSSMR